MDITEENLKNIGSQISEFKEKYHRQNDSVQLMAVSKKKPIELIAQAYQHGQRIFGESYVQEAVDKINKLRHLENIEWHFIGPIQSNKTKDIALNFNWVHSVDRLKIIKRLNQQRDDSADVLNVCLQVNIDNEDSKSGFLADELMAAAQQVLESPRLKLRGLMAIPKPSDNINAQRAAFKRVHHLFAKLKELDINVDTLSIGMSADLEAAIAEGSTIVRIGTAIFGQRDI